jgi:hypothetical protein
MRRSTNRNATDSRPLAMVATLLAASFTGGCGAGHVYRGVQRQAAVDFACPADDVEVKVLDARHKQFQATGCDREARYAWVPRMAHEEEPVDGRLVQGDLDPLAIG